MKLNISLKQAWTALILFVGIVPVTIVAGWYARHIYHHELDSALESERHANELLSIQIKSEVIRFKTLLRNKSDPISALIDDAGSPASLMAINSLLVNIVKREQAIHEVTVLSLEGEVVAAVDPSLGITGDRLPSDKELQMVEAHWLTSRVSDSFPEVIIPSKGRDYIGSPKMYGSDAVFSMAVPIGKPAKAVLIALIYANKIWPTNGGDDHGIGTQKSRDYILDRRGSLITEIQGSSYKPGDLMTNFDIARSGLVQKEWHSENSYIGVVNERVFGTITPIPILNWTLVSEVIASNIMQPIWRAMIQFFTAITGTSVFLVGFVIILARKTTSPISQVCEAINQVAKGDYQQQLPPGRIDELNILSEGFNSMVDALDLSEQELLDSQKNLVVSEEKFRGIFNDSVAAIYLFDEEKHLIDSNPAGLDLLGYTRDELLGMAISEVDADPDKVIPAHNLLLGGGRISNYEHQLIRKDGEIITVLNNSRPLLNANGQVTGMQSTLIDITERKKAELALIEKQKAEDVAQMKNQFLTNMSHEIRTPLNAILGMANIGLRDNTDTRGKETFGHIFNSGRHLLRVINDILDFSKIEAGKLAVESRPFQLISTVEESVNMLMGRAQTRGVKLSLDLSRDLPAWVLGDPHRLQQILLNLLSNAIKFTREGEVLVSVSRDGDIIYFNVSDTGVGLSDEQMSRLFTPFEQADASTTREYGGTGLGLAISYNLAELMGGHIGVRSKVNEGSVFTLSLALDETKAPGIKDLPIPEVSKFQLKGLRILAAEDIDINCLILEDILEQEGASVEFAANGQLAIDRLLQIGVDNIDIILMDVQMPVMDGYEATRCIMEIAPGLPVIGVTAHALEEEREKCRAAGMVGYVTKPIDVKVLISTICRHVDRSGITSA